jgi:hypothetical protein
VNAGAVQRFIAIDVAQPGDEALIKQESFDLTLAP